MITLRVKIPSVFRKLLVATSLDYSFARPWCGGILATFSIVDENVDDEVYDRLRPGTGPSSTAGNINTLAHRLRGRVLYCSFLWPSIGKCLLKYFVTCLYFFTAIIFFQMKSFCCSTMPSKQKKSGPEFPHGNYERFDLDSMNSAECKAEFRVEKQNLPRLVAALQLPPVLRYEQRSICDDIEGLCMLLKRVTYPCRLCDMIPRFGRPVSVISLITNDVIDYIYDVHVHLITQWNQDLLNRPWGFTALC